MGTLLAPKTSKDGTLRKVPGTSDHILVTAILDVSGTSGVFQPSGPDYE